MKKVVILAAMICVVLALMVTGCAKKAAEPAAEVTPPAQAAPAAPGEEMKPGEGVTAGGAVAIAPGESVVFDKKIYFDFDMFDLSSDAIGTLNELAAVLKANGDFKAKVEGNCDERGTNEYNLALGERRAKAAYDYLVSQGIDEARLATISYGEEKPLDPGHNEEAWAKNRRDDFVLSK
ncbi:MAG TPA: peptidoglycan-associated lipoprotein Pal [Deltaproteobacteria bacterium]|nr:peptidoglycan-associated lipoprotein Pal [Deltaproteobacteria bacterium]HPR56125.1 peptidoglycan-associated lipoprotein Pal [Deltaproteobacteria bacterium]HXK48316.1 peptidoglycan-associated lipoprotein Pal [Deltaproteobacteria bacterium]